MILFKRVSFENFMTYQNASVSLENRGLMLIEGINDTNDTFKSNGAGKTTIAEAIVYAIYGSTLRDSKADDVINRQVGKGTKVVLELEKDGQPFRIERYRKHGTYKNGVRIFMGDKNITEKSATDNNNKILDIIGIDFSTFVNSILYGQGDLPMFTTATDKGKKEILENVTGIAIYQEAQAVAKDKLKEVNNEIDLLAPKRQEYQRQLESIQQREDQAQQDYQITADRIVENEGHLVTLREASSNHDAVVEANNKNLEDNKLVLTEQIPGYEERIQEALGELNSLAPVTADSITEEETTELRTYEAKVKVLNSKYDEKVFRARMLADNIRDFQMSDTCPTCGGPVDITHLEKHKTEMIVEHEELLKEVDRLKPQVEAINKDLKEKQAVMDAKKSAVNNADYEYRLAVSEKNQKVDRLQRELDTLRNQVAQIDRDIATNLGANPYTNQIQSVEQVLKALKEVPKPVKLTSEREEVNKNIEQLRESEEPLRERKEQLEQAVVMFSNKGIRSVVLDTVTPFLNTQANKYLSTLSGGVLSVLFTTQEETQSGSVVDKFDISITNNGEVCSYKENSGGERRRIDLAISFAIQDLLQSKAEVKTNIAVYDECFDGLDEIGSENVIEILKEREKEIGTIFVITHNAVLKPLFENTMTVVKDGEFSRIEEELV